MFLFTKMQATGNDFVILNYLNNKLEYSYKLLAEYLCNRHYGVGADGILIIEKSEIADFKMKIFNKDGTQAQMCGNGIRCFAKYVYEKGLINKTEFLIETLAGIKKVEVEIEGGTVVSIKVNMGKPIFEKEKIPILYEGNIENLVINNIKTYPISIGNPHCVCFVKNIHDIDVKKYGELIENYKYFPEKTNVEFTQIVNKNNINLKVWERGVGETLSCGTGACAASVISIKYKDLENIVNVNLSGNKLRVEYINNQIFLIGPAEFVFEGSLEI